MLRALGLGRSVGSEPSYLSRVAVVLLGYVLQRLTRLDGTDMMIGGGEDLARLLGLPVDRYKVLAFAFAGLLSGLGGAL